MMTTHETLIDQLEQYKKGTLSSEERLVIDDKIKNDENFKRQAEEQWEFMDKLQQFGHREKLKASLNEFHREMTLADESPVSSVSTNNIKGIKKYWPTLAVAASVALISVVGTLVAIQSLEKKQTAEYKALRRNMDQIRRSQKVILSDIHKAKDKDVTFRGNYEGTGFLISADGYIATSYHVIRDADSVYVENEKFGRLKTIVVKADKANDIGILKIESKSFKVQVPFTIDANEADIGEDVFTLGFPKEDIVYGEGSISSATGFKGDDHTYQVTVPVNPGNSGGPLINNRGELVGIISGLQTETLGAAFAVKSSVLLAVIRNLGDSKITPVKLAKQNRFKNQNRINQIKKMRDLVFVVNVYN